MVTVSPRLNNGMENAIFPLEIFQEIIKNYDTQLWRLDRPHLNNIALVCKAFLAIARYQIFKRISIDYHRDSRKNRTRMRKLAQIFHEQPQLARLVCILNFSSNAPIESMSHAGDLGSLFKLPNLRTLTVSRGSLICVEGDYESMSDDPLSTFGCRTLIEQYHLHSGTLSTLIISGIGNLPLQKILESSTLKYLRLYQCFMAQGETRPSEGIYSLTKFSAERCINVKFGLIARCTDLGEIELDSEALVPPSTQEMTSHYQGKGDQRPFIQLKAGRFTTLPKWSFIFNAAESIGVAALPSLRHLDMVYPPRKLASGRSRCKDLDRFLSHTPALQTLSWKGRLPKCTLTPIAHQLQSLTLDWRYFDSRLNELSPSVEVLSLVRLPSLKRLSITLSYTVHKEQGEGSVEIALCIRNAVRDIQWLTDIAMDEDSSRFPALEEVDLSVELWKNASLLDNIEWVHSELVRDLQPRFDRLKTNARIRYKTKLEVD